MQTARSILVFLQIAARDMIARGKGGSIVNISSITTRLAFNNHTAYTSSKGAVDSLTKIMALELGPHQVTSPCTTTYIQNQELTQWNWV